MKKILTAIIFFSIILFSNIANAKYVMFIGDGFTAQDFAQMIEIAEYKGCKPKSNFFADKETLYIMMECHINFDYDNFIDTFDKVKFETQDNIELPRDLLKFL